MNRSRLPIALGNTFIALMLMAVAAAAQTPASTTVTTAELKGTVVQVEGTNLVVKLSTGETTTFSVPETRKFVIDGKEVSVHEVRPGTTLTATLKTTTTPVAVRTNSVQGGRVWYVVPPTVILTLPTGENKRYEVKDADNVRFMVNGSPATVFDLRAGMTVSVEKIVAEPDVEVVATTTIVGQAPLAGAPAGQAQPAAAQPAAGEPAAAPGAETQPATPPAESTMSPLMWVGLIVVLIIIGLIVFLMRRKK
jgi:LPXTG-motif cell wall-anchored protein